MPICPNVMLSDDDAEKENMCLWYSYRSLSHALYTATLSSNYMVISVRRDFRAEKKPF